MQHRAVTLRLVVRYAEIGAVARARVERVGMFRSDFLMVSNQAA